MNRGKGGGKPRGFEVKWSLERAPKKGEVLIPQKGAKKIRDAHFAGAAAELKGKLKALNLQFLKYPEVLAVLRVPEDEASNILHRYNASFGKESYDNWNTTNLEMNSYRAMRKRLGLDGKV